ncbi:MAG: type II secretion system protein [Deltaproteobacteria bacterium]|nr:type II secretion system protein [Deltaproteobacteria bacterium]
MTSSKHAFTLLECMIAVAMLGIVITLAMIAPEVPLRESHDVLARERARQWLEYEADAIVQKKAVDVDVAAVLQRALPHGELQRVPGPSVVKLIVSWHRPDGRTGSESLVVVGGLR